MRVLAAGALLALGAMPVEAQTVAGLVRDRATGAPVVRTRVLLRSAPASDSVLARATTDSLGAFHLQAPRPGAYHIDFVLGARQIVRSAPVTVADSATSDEREYHIDVPEPVYFEFEVDKPASPTNNVSPSYPAELQRKGIDGTFAVEFIVDTLGTPEPASFAVLPQYPADPLFVAAVRKVLPRLRFLPAEKDGRKVRQLVQQAFAFGLGR